MYFCTLCPSIGRKERSRQALDRLPLVSNFVTHFWMQHFDGARLSPNSVRNAVWHALNEPVCQYLRTRNPRCATVYIDNSLGPLARDSPCIIRRYNYNYYKIFKIAPTCSGSQEIHHQGALYSAWLKLHCLSSTHTHHWQICCHNTDYVHINGHDRTIAVILAKHCVQLPDDGSLVIRNMLEQF